MGLANHCFAFYISDWKQCTSINGFNSDLTNIYGEPKIWFQVVTYSLHILVVYNHEHNILRLFDTLPNFLFTTSETKCDY